MAEPTAQRMRVTVGRPFEVVSAGRDGEAPRPTLFTETEEVRCTRPQAWLWC